MKLTGNSVLGGTLLVSIAFGFLSSEPHNAEESVHFIQVGQGDATLIKSGHRRILIDVAQRNDYFDAGHRLVSPYLKKCGVRWIDLLLISHPDSDHVGGLPAVAARFAIRKVAIPAVFRDDLVLRRILNEADLLEKTFWLETASHVVLDYGEMHLEPRSELKGANDQSLYVHWKTHEGATVAFSGDATAARELELANLLVPRADLLKVSHHGARDGTTDLWLRFHAPRRAVISVGRNNPYGHPDKEILSRLALAGVKVSRTDIQGTVVFRPKPSSWQEVIRSGN